MIDRHIRRRDEHRLGVGQHVEAVLSVVMAHAGRSDAAERHRLHEQVDIDLIDRAAAEGQFADEAIDRALVAAEDERRQRMRGGGDPAECLVERSVGQDGQDRPEDLILHDPDRPSSPDRRSSDRGSAASGSDRPPMTTFAGSIRPARRETSRALMMRE